MEIEQKFLDLNKKGLFPAPDESVDSFEKRVHLYKELFEDPILFFKKRGEISPVPLDTFEMTPLSIEAFDVNSAKLLVVYTSKGLSLLEGGLTHVIETEGIWIPLIQLRKSFLEKKKLLGMYSKEEIIKHEALHFCRGSFNEPKFEEFFPYLTSQNRFRKMFGPIIRRIEEGQLFLLTLSVGVISSLFSFLTLSIIFFSLSFILLILGIARLFKYHNILKKASKNLKTLKVKPLPLLFRLSDSEIEKFANSNNDEILSFVKEKTDFRWQLLKKSYFNPLEL